MHDIRHSYRKRRLLPIILLIISVTAMLLISGCIKNEADAENDKKIIITSIVTTTYFAERIAGEKAEIISLIPPGASPHSYEPTPGQLEMVSRADLFVKIGSGIEFELEWVDKIIKMNKGIEVTDCSTDIELIKMAEVNGDGDEIETDRRQPGTDPHIWLSPVNAKVMAQNIYKGLVAIDPGNEKYYYENLKGLQTELDDLDSRIREMTEGYTNRKILVFHPAWTYFAREYGLEQIAVEEDGKEPTLKSMEALISQARRLGIKIIFASPEFDIKSAEVIASEIGGEVVLISPLPQDYIADMEEVARAFEAGLAE